MLKIAHIINPVEIHGDSDLVVAQPITFETMRRARQMAMGEVEVNLYALQYHEEKPIPLPREFQRLPALTRSVTDLATFKKIRKLPLIKDILDRLHDTADTADYFVYTNVDIALQPYFYRTVAAFVQQGHDAFVINRRTIPDTFSTVDDLPLMYAQAGEPHKGYDCFVFKRTLYPRFTLGGVCIGTAWVGRALLANLFTLATHFREFRDHHLTFHLGDSLPWRNPDYADYMQYNRAQYLQCFDHLEAENGPFNEPQRSYLLDGGDKRQMPPFDPK